MQKNPGMNSRTLREMFDCGNTKTEVHIVNVRVQWSIHTNKTSRVSEYEEINIYGRRESSVKGEEM